MATAEELLAAVDKQCAAVQRVAVGSERVVDRLRHGLSVVNDRCARIKHDVDDWERAVNNVNAAARELEEAASAYTTPRFVDAVVRGDSRDPSAMVKALLHLTAAQDYMAAKPANSVGDRLSRKVASNLEKAIVATESFITSSVIQSVRTAIVPPANVLAASSSAYSPAHGHQGNSNRRGGPSSAVVVEARLMKSDWRRRLNALHTLVEQHAMLFERLNAPSEVVTSLSERIVRYFEALLSVDYQRRHEGFDSDDAGAAALRSGRGGSLAAMRYLFTRGNATASFEEEQQARGATMSTYQQGDHPFRNHSGDVRALVAEGCDVLRVVVLRAFPTSEEDQRYHLQVAAEKGREIREDAFLLPSELVLRVGIAVFERAHRAVRHLARSPSIGIHDAIFAALDIVAELWQWRRVARRTPGQSSGLATEVDSNVDTIMSAAHELLGDLQLAKGNLSPAELVRSVASDEFVEANGLKLSPCVLQLIGVHSREIGDAAVTGYSSDEVTDDDDDDDPHMDDYSDLGDGAHAAPPKRPKKRGAPVIPRTVRTRWLPSLDGAVHASTTSLLRFLKHLLGGFAAVSCLVLAGGTCDEADALLAEQRKRRGSGDGHGSAGGQQSWAEPVEAYVDCCVSGHLADIDAIADAAAVTLNEEDEAADHPLAPFNRALFVANNAYFVMRALTEDAPFAATVHNRKVCEPLIAAYEHRLEMAIDNYAHMWGSVLPAAGRDGHLLDAAASDASLPLNKKQRAAIKLWYEDACAGISSMIHASRSHVVAQTALREALSDAAADAVANTLHQFDYDVTKGREWSTRPHKHLSAPVDEIIAQVRSIFGSASASAIGSTSYAAGAQGLEL